MRKAFDRSWHVGTALFVGGLFLLAGGLNGQTQALAFSFGPTEAVVTGIAPGSTTAVFSVANNPGQYYRTLVRRERLIVADQAGTATFSMPEGVSRWSIWFAVDVRTGEFAVASPAGAAISYPMVAPTFLAGASDDTLDFDADLADVFVVQRGSGAWVTTFAKGSSQDLNRSGKSLRIGMAGLRSFDHSGARPARLTPADVIVVVNPHTMQYYIGRPAAR